MDLRQIRRVNLSENQGNYYDYFKLTCKRCAMLQTI